MKLKVVLKPQEEGGYTVYVPSLPGCISQGETYEEALGNIKEAIELYLEADEDELLQYFRLIFTIIVNIIKQGCLQFLAGWRLWAAAPPAAITLFL
jgi:predicted RNase H-like HicB family nuclease